MKLFVLALALLLIPSSLARADNLEHMFQQRERDAGRDAAYRIMNCKAERLALAKSLVPAILQDLGRQLGGQTIAVNHLPDLRNPSAGPIVTEAYMTRGYVLYSEGSLCKIHLEFDGNGEGFSHQPQVGLTGTAYCDEPNGTSATYQLGKGITQDSGCVLY